MASGMPTIGNRLHTTDLGEGMPLESLPLTSNYQGVPFYTFQDRVKCGIEWRYSNLKNKNSFYFHAIDIRFCIDI